MRDLLDLGLAGGPRAALEAMRLTEEPIEQRLALRMIGLTLQFEQQLRGCLTVLGIRGVPFFVLDEQLGVSGGQEQAVFINALEQVWAAANPLKLINTPTDDSMICEDESCAVAPADVAARG